MCIMKVGGGASRVCPPVATFGSAKAPTKDVNKFLKTMPRICDCNTVQFDLFVTLSSNLTSFCDVGLVFIIFLPAFTRSAKNDTWPRAFSIDHWSFIGHFSSWLRTRVTTSCGSFPAINNFSN